MRRLQIVLCALVAGAAWAETQPAPALSAEDRAFLDKVNRPVILRVPGMDRVRVLRDLVYETEAGQKADVYLPPGAKRPAPIVILIHGGMGPEFPVRPKAWGIYQSYGRLLAASGLAAVIHNHRAGFPKVDIAAATADLRAVIQFARAHAKAWGADADRICLIAFSGGGPLLSLAMREPSPAIRCLVGMYPILDIQHVELFKGQLGPADLATYSPVEQLARNPASPP